MSFNQAAIKKRGRPQKNIDLAGVLKLEQAGKTDQEIADELGVCVRTFRAFRKEHCITPAAGHGGTRQGAGRKKFIGGPWDPYIERQQAIDARVNSIDVGIRTERNINKKHWLRWAGSAFEYNKEQGVYTSGAGFGIPAVISFRV